MSISTRHSPLVRRGRMEWRSNSGYKTSVTARNVQSNRQTERPHDSARLDKGGCLKRLSERNALITMAALMITAIASINVGKADDEGDNRQPLRGRVVALGIPGASAISAVGTFLPGGPIHDNPGLAAFTMPGRVLDPRRQHVQFRGATGSFRPTTRLVSVD